MLVLLAAHLVIGIGVIAVGDRLGRWAFVVAAAAPAATLAWALARADGILDGRPVTERASWVAGLSLRFDVRVDGFAWLMVVLVSGIGVLICAYSVWYFSHPPVGTGRLAGLLTIFAGAMTGLVTADQVALLFLCWEATSVASYLLIGNQDRDPRARAAALQALLITGAGGLVLLIGLILVGQAAGTYQLSGMIAAGPVGGVATGGLVCVLIGAFTKSAQQPFGSWLPGAMVAPTPVSAYLHSATMVKAGVYLIARFSPAFASSAPWRVLCVGVGLLTMAVGAYRAMRQTDLKLLLAMGTVSQLGLLVALFGLGIPAVTEGAVLLLVAHAVFKSALFMVVGIIDHETGTRDVRVLRLDGPRWRLVKVGAVVSAVSMAGVPVTFGFVAKEAVLVGLVDHRHDVLAGTLVLAVVAGLSALTVAYSSRFVLALFGKLNDPSIRGESISNPASSGGESISNPVGGGAVRHHPRHPLTAFAAPATLLAAASLALGLRPEWFDRIQQAALAALHPGEEVHALHLWHGFTSALAISAAIIAAGLLLVVARRRVAALQRHRIEWLSAERGYLASLRGLNRLADRSTAVVQSGSLPAYIGVILLTVTIVPLTALLIGDGWPGGEDVVDLPIHVPIAGLIVVAALATAILRRRFAAALTLGAVGYGMAGLYVSFGAPDLALTQFAIETLSVVLFVLVLRYLPDDPTIRQPMIARLWRLVVSVGIGVFVLVFALATSGSRTRPPVSEEFVARSQSEGKGGNVVNVTVIDFRGLDTLGEITVLVVAGVGAVGLARMGRPRQADPGAQAPQSPVTSAEEVTV